VFGIAIGAFTLLLTLSLLSYDQRGGNNWIGVVGNALAELLVSTFGFGAAVFPVELLLGTLYLFGRRSAAIGAAQVASVVITLLAGCALLHVTFGDYAIFGGHLAGGTLGELVGELLRSLLGLAGAYVIAIAFLMMTLVLRTSISVLALSRKLMSAAKTSVQFVREQAKALWKSWDPADAEKLLDLASPEKPREPPQGPPLEAVLLTGPQALPQIALEEPGQERSDGDPVGVATAKDEGIETGADELAQSASSARRKRVREPVIVPPNLERAPLNPQQSATGSQPSARVGGSQTFVLPGPTLLSEVTANSVPIDELTLKDNAAKLVEKLAAYGVRGRVDEIHPGPVVTMYEFEPESGTKISKIASLSDDLAMALAAQKVRIVAPIPGKARVGFELPNQVRQTVYLRELLEDERWQQLEYALPVAFGKDIAGRAFFGDLSKMPHLLVAGATGSGKSVGISIMLVSLLTKKTPEEVRLLMIDPKVVELAVFDGIPHMLLPVVTDMKKAALALRWAVDEMERRYQLFAEAGARNITSYNDRVAKVLRGDAPIASLAVNRQKAHAASAVLESGAGDPADAASSAAAEADPKKLPHVVLVVDEFADLMMVAAREVETAIARLAQKARAAGIHVILATQRPSVDVITGMIKANFPSRIAFKVSQREDSKTILGRNGAEHLLGNGDMLVLLPGTSDLKRVHSAFIQESDVQAVCDFLRAQSAPVYDEEILKPREDDAESGLSEPEAGGDSLYDRAVALVAEVGYCSISHIQRNLGVGYNKAAKLVERMEKEGVVGMASGKAGGRREVLIQPR
jgi:DNA segregation ATPase FtsK/SpoIIIE, S-DNA-T family